MSLEFDIEGAFRAFIEDWVENDERKYEIQLAQILIDPETPFFVDFSNLFRYNPDLAEHLLDTPKDVITYFETIVQGKLFMRGITNVTNRVRIENLPQSSDLRKIDYSHIGKMIQIEGIVVKTGLTEQEIINATFRCIQCGEMIEKKQNSQFTVYPKPSECPGSGCPNPGFAVEPENSTFKKIQKISIQESPDKVPPGRLPRTFKIQFEEALTDSVKPGERVKIVGTVEAIQKKKHDQNPVMILILNANNIQKQEVFMNEVELSESDIDRLKEEAKKRDHLKRVSDSIAPKLYGLDIIKQALALQQCEGTAIKIHEERIRGQSHILLAGDPAQGKALSIKTPIPTIDGWKTMEEIAVGDIVFDDVGEPCRVIATSPTMLNRAVFEVFFDDDSSIITDEEHLWYTSTVASRVSERRKKNRQPPKHPELGTDQSHKRILHSVKNTKELKETLRTKNKESRINHAIRNAKPLNLPPRKLPIPPYTLGAWLGDGTTQSGSITCYDSEILEQIKKDGFKIREQSVKHHYGILGLHTKLRKADLLGNKHIPQIYLRSSIEQRLRLLRGLMDTDGSCAKDHNSSFCSTKIKLANGFRELLHSFGIKHRMTSSDATLYGRKVGTRHRIRFTTNLDIFYIKRKRNRLPSKIRKNRENRYIVKTHRIKSVPVKCLQVDSESHLYLAGKQMVPTHNSEILQFMSSTNPRGINITGKGSTAAGLTAAVVKDEESGEWTLMAGAMVIADGGIVCADEFEKMRNEDRSAMHPAMAQQKIPINKAGINVELNTRCSVLAACNPKLGRWNDYQDLTKNINLPIPLISRFDLIFVLKNDRTFDEEMKRVDHVLNLRKDPDNVGVPFTHEDLRKLFALARTIKPKLTDYVLEELRKFYGDVIKAAMKADGLMITLRQLDGLIRLTEASAKLHLREETTVQDARIAIKILNESLLQSGIDPETGQIDVGMLLTGVPQSLRDKMIQLVDVVQELCKSNLSGEHVTGEYLMDQLTNRWKINEDEIAKLLVIAKREGVLFQPRPGLWKIS